MYTLIVENSNGDTLNFLENSNYDLLKVTGLNPPTSTLNFSEMANYDGSTYNSGRVNNRNIVLTIKIYPDVEVNRINLYNYFKMKKSIRIHYENENRKVYIDGYVELFEFDPFTMNETAQISIICPDPYWKESKESKLEFSNVINLFEFPFAIDSEGIEFSKIEKLTSVYFNNSEIDIGLTIEFRANANQILNPRFVNRTTQEYFGVNFDMSEGDVIRICTIRGRKSVTLIRDAVETNIINVMQRGSKWVQLTSGLNELSYECDEGATNLTVTVSVIRCFEGV